MAGEVESGTTVTRTELIDDTAVEAVLIAAPGAGSRRAHDREHRRARKPVFCEKPLAASSERCVQVMEAESAAGARLVQVGFMRRYDEGYGHVKQAVDDKTIGDVLLAHCIHRNAQSPPVFRSEMLLTESSGPRNQHSALAPG